MEDSRKGPPNYGHNINLSTNPKELDWNLTVLTLINKSPDGSVEAPFRVYDDLVTKHLKFIVAGFIHLN